MEEAIRQVQQSNDCPVPNGSLMIIGGAEKKDNQKKSHQFVDHGLEILRQFVSLITSPTPVIELVTTAGSEDVEGTFEEYKKAFLSLGATEVNHVHHERREYLDHEEMKSRVNAAHAVFFAGGDQLKLTSIYGGTPFMFFLKTRYIYEEMVIGGTSAGAMALSTPMIYSGTGSDEMIAGEIKITTGFEFLRDVCIDTHFVARGRFARMAQVIAGNPSNIGIGLEEDTAMVIRNGVEVTVVGSGVVIVIDGHQCFGNDVANFTEHRAVTIRNLEVSVLSNGDKFLIPQLNPPHK